MFVHLGLILSFALHQFSWAQFVSYDSNVQLLLESKAFVNNYDEAIKLCEKKQAFLAVLDNPQLYNFAYETLEERKDTVLPNRFFVGLRFSPGDGVFKWVDGSTITTDQSLWLPVYQNQASSGPNTHCAFMAVFKRRITEYGPYFTSLSRQGCDLRAHYICQKGKPRNGGNQRPTTKKTGDNSNNNPASSDNTMTTNGMADESKSNLTAVWVIAVIFSVLAPLCFAVHKKKGAGLSSRFRKKEPKPKEPEDVYYDAYYEDK